MTRKQIVYSEAFKLQVVQELESGELSSQYQARQRYGIKGGDTLNRWLAKYGRQHLIPKVVRVETRDERDRIQEYRRRIRELEKALADAKVKEVLAQAQYEVLCEELGVDAEEFKKKLAGSRSGEGK